MWSPSRSCSWLGRSIQSEEGWHDPRALGRHSGDGSHWRSNWMSQQLTGIVTTWKTLPVRRVLEWGIYFTVNEARRVPQWVTESSSGCNVKRVPGKTIKCCLYVTWVEAWSEWDLILSLVVKGKKESGTSVKGVSEQHTGIPAQKAKDPNKDNTLMSQSPTWALWAESGLMVQKFPHYSCGLEQQLARRQRKIHNCHLLNTYL